MHNGHTDIMLISRHQTVSHFSFQQSFYDTWKADRQAGRQAGRQTHRQSNKCCIH